MYILIILLLVLIIYLSCTNSVEGFIGSQPANYEHFATFQYPFKSVWQFYQSPWMMYKQPWLLSKKQYYQNSVPTY